MNQMLINMIVGTNYNTNDIIIIYYDVTMIHSIHVHYTATGYVHASNHSSYAMYMPLTTRHMPSVHYEHSTIHVVSHINNDMPSVHYLYSII